MSREKEFATLDHQIGNSIEKYFTHLDGVEPIGFYDLFLTKIEPPLIKAVLKYTKNNKSKAASVLGLSRGTLGKKLKQYKLEN
jgi:Fis family transcriptional regulator, factor for inversion stimulation protein